MNRRDRVGALTDAFVYGPFAMYSARSVKHPYFRAGLIVAGALVTAVGLWQLLNPTSDEESAELGAADPHFFGSSSAPRGRFRGARSTSAGKAVPGNAVGRPDPRSGRVRALRRPILAPRA